MIALRTTKRKNANRLSARTIARWENEGGAPKPLAQEKREQRAALAEEEERVLRCLGAAVIIQWNDLSTGTQRALFEYAVSMGDPHDTAQLKVRLRASCINTRTLSRNGVEPRRAVSSPDRSHSSCNFWNVTERVR